MRLNIYEQGMRFYGEIFLTSMYGKYPSVPYKLQYAFVAQSRDL